LIIWILKTYPPSKHRHLNDRWIFISELCSFFVPPSAFDGYPFQVQITYQVHTQHRRHGRYGFFAFRIDLYHQQQQIGNQSTPDLRFDAVFGVGIEIN
jgi:hypothetical protein